MAGSIVRNNDNVNVIYEFEEESELPAYTVEDCARNLFVYRGQGDHGDEENPIVWEDLVEQDWLDLVYMYLYDVQMNLAAELQQKLYGTLGQEAAQAIIDERHGLGE